MAQRWIVGCVILFIIGYWLVMVNDRRICRFPAQEKFTISTVTRGQFIKTIPQVATPDTSDDGSVRLKAYVDQMFLEEIYFGLKATCSIDDTDHLLTVTDIHPELYNGQFVIILEYPKISHQQKRNSYRIRLQLAPPREALLVSLGGFYKDTRGEWIYVVDGKRAVKRPIKLGERNTEHFEVVDGLKPGERVITSSYEKYGDKDEFILNSQAILTQVVK